MNFTAVTKKYLVMLLFTSFPRFWVHRLQKFLHEKDRERERDRDKASENKEKREILKFHFFSETWPRLVPGPYPYMHNRLPLSFAL